MPGIVATRDIRPYLRSKNPIVKGMAKGWVFFSIFGLFLFSLYFFLSFLQSGNIITLIVSISAFIIALKFLKADL